MTVKFCSLGSGSSGNCYLVKDEKTAILIDAGISGKRIFEGLEETDTRHDMVKAVIVTHEHIDHVKSLPIVSSRIPQLYVYANSLTWEAITRPVDDLQKKTFVTGEEFIIGDFVIKPFAISHDAAEPVGFSLNNEGRKISFCTDSGHITEEIFEEIHDADLLLLEANHEKEMVLFGRYPYPLKQRILSDRGHLSNVTAGKWLSRIVERLPKRRRVLLAHLSRENNTPEVAMLAVKNTLEENSVYMGDDLKVGVVLRDRRSEVFEV